VNHEEIFTQTFLRNAGLFPIQGLHEDMRRETIDWLCKAHIINRRVVSWIKGFWPSRENSTLVAVRLDRRTVICCAAIAGG